MAKQVTTTPAAQGAPVAPAKGQAMVARWGACLQGKGAPVMPAAIKQLPPTTVITCLAANNPKRGASAPAFAAYGFGGPAKQAASTGGPATQGATTTLGAFISALHKAMGQTASNAAAHVAWDLNHGFISIASPAIAPAPQQQQSLAA